jgi:hypothetical protein
MSKIAAIGTREIERHEIPLLESAGIFYASLGHEIHTGNAVGSDQAYALGASTVNPRQVHLYLPWKGYESKAIIDGNVVHYVDESDQHMKLLAERNHEKWKSLSPQVKNLMIRNTQIVYGSVMVLANPNWNRPGYGGTGHGMRVAAELGIPVWLVREHKWWNGV